MKAKTIQGKSLEEFNKSLEQAITERFQPTLAIVFVTAEIEWKKIRDLLDKKGIEIFGAKTAMPFDDNSSLEEGIIIMLLDMHPEYFKIELQDISHRSISETVTELCESGTSSFSKPAFLISVADVSNPGEEIMKKFVDETSQDLTISGAYSGDAETWNGNIFSNDSSSNNGILALILDEEKIDVRGIAVSGWRAVGTEKTVTKSDGIWLQQIDNQPAFEVLKKFVGDITIGEVNQQSIVKLNTETFVLQAERDGDSPAYFATLEYNTENGAIKCSTPISEGTKFRFSLPPDFEVVDEVIETSAKVKRNKLTEADAMIVFSCIGRVITLGPMAQDEIQGLSQTWNIPTAGFFSLGEFGRVEGGRPEYHATTCSWVALKEK